MPEDIASKMVMNKMKKGMVMWDLIICLIIALGIAFIVILVYMAFTGSLYNAADKFLGIFRG